ncbi:MAG: hypothetical protein D3924_20560 [Candidatus Electrothrix sp. AR4]|nr:hypothetical protein [Candidatus Electrothrix sp. AR4]
MVYRKYIFLSPRFIFFSPVSSLSRTRCCETDHQEEEITTEISRSKHHCKPIGSMVIEESQTVTKNNRALFFKQIEQSPQDLSPARTKNGTDKKI